MAQNLPLAFPIQSSPSIATYSYTDIAEGTGIVKFYGAVHNEGETNSFMLTTNTPYSNQIIVSGAVTTTASAERLRNDTFSVTFNRPQNLKGKAYLNMSIGGNLVSGYDAVERMAVSGAYLAKFDGTTETAITVLVSGASMLHGGVDVTSKTILTEFNISSVAHFKKGDSLRLIIPLWAFNGYDNGEMTHGGYGCDPIGRADPNGKTINTTETTKMELYVPFVLNI